MNFMQNRIFLILLSILLTGSACSPIPRGRSIPRTPLIDCNVEILSGSDHETDKNDNSTRSDNYIPPGKSIPRTPLGILKAFCT